MGRNCNCNLDNLPFTPNYCPICGVKYELTSINELIDEYYKTEEELKKVNGEASKLRHKCANLYRTINRLKGIPCNCDPTGLCEHCQNYSISVDGNLKPKKE